MEPRLSHLENRVDAAYHGADDPAPHLTSDPDMVSSLPVGTERRLGELGEDDFEIPYLVPPVEAGARETQVKQDRPVSRKVPFQWTCSQLCGAWCTCTVPALAALCSSQWTRTLSAEYFRPQASGTERTSLVARPGANIGQPRECLCSFRMWAAPLENVAATTRKWRSLSLKSVVSECTCFFCFGVCSEEEIK